MRSLRRCAAWQARRADGFHFCGDKRRFSALPATILQPFSAEPKPGSQGRGDTEGLPPTCRAKRGRSGDGLPRPPHTPCPEPRRPPAPKPALARPGCSAASSESAIGERVLGPCIDSSMAKSRPVLSSLRRWLLLRVVGVVVVWRRVLGVGADLQNAPNWDGRVFLFWC